MWMWGVRERGGGGSLGRVWGLTERGGGALPAPRRHCQTHWRNHGRTKPGGCGSHPPLMPRTVPSAWGRTPECCSPGFGPSPWSSGDLLDLGGHGAQAESHMGVGLLPLLSARRPAGCLAPSEPPPSGRPPDIPLRASKLASPGPPRADCCPAPGLKACLPSSSTRAKFPQSEGRDRILMPGRLQASKSPALKTLLQVWGNSGQHSPAPVSCYMREPVMKEKALRTRAAQPQPPPHPHRDGAELQGNAAQGRS